LEELVLLAVVLLVEPHILAVLSAIQNVKEFLVVEHIIIVKTMVETGNGEQRLLIPIVAVETWILPAMPTVRVVKTGIMTA